MSTQLRCHCQSCVIRGLTGPAIVITVGILFLLHQIRGEQFYFGHTWPVVLLVVGLLQLASSVASREGHIDVNPPTAPQAPPPTPPSSTETAPPQMPYGSQGQ